MVDTATFSNLGGYRWLLHKRWWTLTTRARIRGGYWNSFGGRKEWLQYDFKCKAFAIEVDTEQALVDAQPLIFKESAAGLWWTAVVTIRIKSEY